MRETVSALVLPLAATAAGTSKAHPSIPSSQLLQNDGNMVRPVNSMNIGLSSSLLRRDVWVKYHYSR